MGFNILHFELLTQLLPKINNRPIELISMGTPDIVMSFSHIKKHFGDEKFLQPIYRPDSTEVKKRHGITNNDEILDSEYFFKEIGVDLSVLDVEVFNGSEIICDLNEPISANLKNKYDIVLDAGTLEHCFNVGQCIKNFLSLAKTGGFIFHSNPLFMINHGFYNLNPTFYTDFYRDNGHKLVTPIYWAKVYNGGYSCEVGELPPLKRYQIPDKEKAEDSSIWVIAKKNHDKEPFWPTQSKYKKIVPT